jgi:alkylation response protein AidB-like acyl-CoA dehydrogenase
MTPSEQENTMAETPYNFAESTAEFASSAHDFLRKESPLARLRGLRNSAPGFERPVWRALAEAGWTSILVPEQLGGLGLDLSIAAAVAKEVGQHPMPEPFIGAAVQAVSLLAALDASPIRDHLLAEAAAGNLIIGVAWQESVGDYDGATPGTAAVDSDNNVVVTGEKRWVLPGEGADGWLASATNAGETGIYWIPRGTAGVTVRSETRVDGSVMGHLVFTGAVIPSSYLLARGSAARRALDEANNAARFVQGGELLGIASRAFDITLDYLKTRVQFGKPIGANQALKHRMVDAYLKISLASACIEDGWRSYLRNETTLASLASRVKARCTETALHVTRLAIQLHGAIGYTDECDIGLYVKRALHLSCWLGNEETCLRYFLTLQRSSASEARAADHAEVEVQRDADWNAMDEEHFRSMIRAFLERNYPKALRFPPRRLHWNEIKDWYLMLSRQGWLAPAWPKAFGGMALPPDKLLAFFEEMEGYGVARTPDQGIINLGPILIRFGTREQQETFLPKILSGENVWCQGYSEPNAGSDLASLGTEAIVDGDEFIVNGQKIWTTLAQDATHIFMLVRTSKVGKKQAGISFLLADLKTPGITIRPIRNIVGEEEFCEVFFDNVRVPRENLVGEMNSGWKLAKDLLGFERIFVGSPQQSQYAMSQLTALAESRDLFSDAVFLSKYARLHLDLTDLGALYSHFAEIVKQGGTLPPSVSLLKIFASETYGRIGMQLVEAAQEDGAVLNEAGNDQGVNSPAPLMHSMITTIYAGTNEIQRNIVAKQVLEMPE